MHVSAQLKVIMQFWLDYYTSRLEWTGTVKLGGGGGVVRRAFRNHEYLLQGAILSTSSHKSAHFPPTPGEISAVPSV